MPELGPHRHPKHPCRAGHFSRHQGRHQADQQKRRHHGAETCRRSKGRRERAMPCGDRTKDEREHSKNKESADEPIPHG
jgi:hypothetical protein